MKFYQFFNNKVFSPLIFSIIFILTAVVLNICFKEDGRISKLYSDFQNEIYEKQKHLNILTEKISNELEYDNYEFLYSAIGDILNDNNGTFILIYDNDLLTFWSDHSVPVPDLYSNELFNVEFNRFENGWFLVSQIKTGNKRIIGLYRVKNDYKYQNEYLINDFNDDFNLPSGTDLETEGNGYKIYSKTGEYLFSLQMPVAKKISDRKLYILLLFYLLGFLFFISFLFQAHRLLCMNFKKTSIFVLTFIVDLIILRLLVFYFEIPRILFESDLFSPVYYAGSKFLPSLGHFLIDTLLLLIIAYIICIHIKFPQKESPEKNYFLSNFLIILILLLVFVLYKGLIFLLDSLIINSSIALDLNKILDFSIFSILSYFIIISLVLSFFLFASKLLDVVYRIGSLTKHYRSTFIISLFLILFLDYFFDKDQLINTVFLLVFIVSYPFFVKSKMEFLSFTTVVFYIFLFALFTTNVLYKNLTLKEYESRKLLAIKLSAERDPVTEYLFQKMEIDAHTDDVLKKHVNNAVYDEQAEVEAIEYLKKNYINDYWSKYNIQIIICNEKKLLDIEFEGIIINCNEYFDKKITQMGLPTGEPNLFYMDYGFGDDSYIGILEFIDTTRATDSYIRVYIETVSKIVPKGLGYPELLIDRKHKRKNDASSYSYAIYKRNELIKMVGDFSYSINDNEYTETESEFVFFDKYGYNHLLYKPNKEASIIIGKPENSFLDIVSPFSYLFIFYGIYILLFLVIIYFPYRSKKIELNFRHQLKISIVSVIVVSFLLIGVTTLSYIKSLNNNKNYDNLREKAHSVLIELEHKLASEEQLTPEIYDYLSILLIKFSNVFFSDINLYDIDGKLIASSRPQIFEEGLISDRINARAFEAMADKKLSNFIQKERICSYEYLSAYVPFRNEKNKLIAYLNLPYFAKQDELRQEISTFLVAFINIYVILIAISIFIALLVSNYISRPLKLIKEKISQLRLGKSNEKIEWERKDEIGDLIIEYNRMIDELARSAELLAKSERESAWREMAKQVAHEIKNPLTPMKLNIQHLRKAWHDKTSDWEERLNKFSDTLIEQIDSLSSIASEFSDFANMPKTEVEKIELSENIKNSIELHKNYENIRIEYLTDGNTPYHVLADKKQILRVFNNLIKNSVQAIGRNKIGWIKISIEKQNDLYLIKVSDNGSGISKEQGEKIFIPSFTTKTSGMGLGLSMVKSIVLSAGGTISFTSEPDEGTTFFITLPKFEE